jgi:hypothetical protein
MNMVQSKTKTAELESEAFKVMERLNAGVDVDLFSKTVISVVGDKHHGHPVIAGITQNFFRAIANYIFHIEFFLSHLLRVGKCLPHATKKHIWFDRKKGCDFSSAGLSLRFRPRSILSRNYKMGKNN